ncbi:hypothetical protein F5144DRAFT_552971 [Chaetomium tenue]|uniref:Uncharacterized protein n=1 Tax=Chaetomium tenue TaxID=1854479 RepID=A0ACB7PKW2_9PEZI|nr:hypothetical protein F5144DRAFT_552971 [Chaetomium globosum]
MSTSNTPSREEQIAAVAARAEEVQKQNPSADLKLEQKWWVPSVDFGIYLKDALPQDVSARFNEIVGNLVRDKFSSEALAEAHQQSRELLQADYPQALQKSEEMIFNHGAHFAEAHRYLMEADGAKGSVEKKEL